MISPSADAPIAVSVKFGPIAATVVGVGLVAALAFLYFFRLGAVGVIDYDEAVYAEVSQAMNRSGDLLVPRSNGETFFEKPAFLYWTQVAGFRLFGVNAWGVRVFNALAGAMLCVSLCLIARRPLGTRAALLVAAVQAVSLEPTILARVALTDAWLSLWLTLGLACFHRASERERRGVSGRSALVWTGFYSGLAMLTKGAIGIVLPGAAILLFACMNDSARFVLRPSYWMPGLLVAIGVGSSWYLLLGLTQPDGFSFMTELFWEHHVGRFLAAKQGHGGPFVYYIPVLLLGALPWTAYLVAAVAHRVWRGDDEAARLLTLFGIFALITCIFFSFARTKLPNYIGPVFPTVALFVASYLDRKGVVGTRGWRLATMTTVVLLIGLAAGTASVGLIIRQLPHWLGDKAYKVPGLSAPLSLGPWPYVAATPLLVAALIALRAYRDRDGFLLRWALPASFAAFALIVAAALLPIYDHHFAGPLRRAAVRAREIAPEQQTTTLIGLKHVPSVIFYGRRPTRTISRGDAQTIAELFARTEPTVAITTRHDLDVYVRPCQGDGALDIIEEYTGYVVVRLARATAK